MIEAASPVPSADPGAESGAFSRRSSRVVCLAGAKRQAFVGQSRAIGRGTKFFGYAARGRQSLRAAWVLSLAFQNSSSRRLA
jgi:hypothetical protein